MADWINVSATDPRIGYVATAAQTVFVVPFVFFTDEDLQVYQNTTLLTLATHYTVTGAENPTGGTVTLLTGATLSDAILIVRTLVIEQTTHIPPSGPLDVPAINVQNSRLIAIDQQLQLEIDRAIMVDIGDPIPTPLPNAAARALMNLTFDALGNPTASLPATGTTPVSSAMAPVVAGATLTIARTAMWDASSVMSPVVLATSLANARAALGVSGNTKVTKTTDYTVLNSDKGAAIVLSGGSFTKLTFTGVYDADFICTIINGETTSVGKGITGTLANDFTLYPTQGYLIYNDLGVGLRLLGGIQPYKANSLALFCDATLGSDNVLIADGLAAGVRAKKTQLAVRQQLYQDFNHNGSQPTVTLTGVFTEVVQFLGQPMNCSVFFWNGSAPGAYTIKATGAGVSCMGPGDGTVMEISNVTFDGNGFNAVGIQLHQQCVLDVLTGCTFGNFGTGSHMGADGGGWTLNIGPSYTVTGAANSHMNMQGCGTVNHNGSGTVTITGTPVITVWFRSFGGILYNLAPSITWSGALTAGCTKWVMGPGSSISLSGNAANVPGSTAGTPVTGVAPAASLGWAVA